MVSAVPIQPFLDAHLPLIDVRSPGEFARGHIPGVHSLPLFSDAERASVGTLYKQQGRDTAVLEGLRIVGPKMASLVEAARTLAPDGDIGVHCWRGGERSASVAWLLEKAGFNRVFTLEHGYKAFRNHVLAAFPIPWNLLILGGYTGTGKTELLGRLRELGEQVIDLERIANHKGSAYGGIGEGAQPTTEHFENLLWHQLVQFNPERPVWVEDESQLIGRAKVPDAFFAQMRSASVCFVDMPREERAARLVADYGALPKQALAEATTRIQRRLGPQHTKAALEALEAGHLHQMAMITLNYYDKTYARGLALRDPHRTRFIEAGRTDRATLAQRLKHEGSTIGSSALNRA